MFADLVQYYIFIRLVVEVKPVMNGMGTACCFSQELFLVWSKFTLIKERMFAYNTNECSHCEVDINMLSIGLKPDESKLVKDYTLLPLLLDVLENDRSVLCQSDLKTSEVTRVMIDRLQTAALADLTAARRSMRENDLKVYQHRKTNLGIEVEFVCRGYHHKLSMLWGLIEAEIEQRSYTYLGLNIADKGGPH
ncbi:MULTISPECIES: hypothetical protein [Paenibacillus]|jgi:hypothetical protein|nr:MULTISPECIES: hypothetical protein [Paenibacillus]ETT37868.1 hypothetical protein C169_13419 [Paenibacillus sp. FSL R5-808]